MTAPVPFASVNDAISTIVNFYEQEVQDGKIKDGELKEKIEELKKNPKFQEKMKRGGPPRGPLRGMIAGQRGQGMLDGGDGKFNIKKYSFLVAMMVRCHFKGQDDGDDDDEDTN
ncbi:Hypothetical predicted protein [Xyrichtys novacula]|uniref:Uncharacterized protein n=1 Tax=Xyrichtys novacula TaxID=13765 RepID=A0AAV1FM68_XYRNO|nr:Hypothetical predicted protein [Xyrichtys novacula]